MAAELIVALDALGLGLGQLLETGRDLSDMSLVIVAIILILFVGIAVELVCVRPDRARGAALARPDRTDVQHGARK